MTFEQFAYFVASQVKKMEGDCNVHWRPFYLRCPYCDNKYDTFIGRMETFERDVRYVSKGLIPKKIALMSSDRQIFTTLLIHSKILIISKSKCINVKIVSI